VICDVVFAARETTYGTTFLDLRAWGYLFLPPDHDGEVPDGYFAYRCPTFANWAILRALGGVPAIKGTRIDPLAQADSPDDNVFLNVAELAFNTVHANDFSFHEELVQEEPVEARPSRRVTACGRSSRAPPGSAAA
jgi:hypothetical protein